MEFLDEQQKTTRDPEFLKMLPAWFKDSGGLVAQNDKAAVWQKMSELGAAEMDRRYVARLTPLLGSADIHRKISIIKTQLNSFMVAESNEAEL